MLALSSAVSSSFGRAGSTGLLTGGCGCTFTLLSPLFLGVECYELIPAAFLVRVFILVVVELLAFKILLVGYSQAFSYFGLLRSNFDRGRSRGLSRGGRSWSVAT